MSAVAAASIDSKDFWAGLMFIAIGGGAMFVARDYAFGTALRMGPGFFPSAARRDPGRCSASTSSLRGAAQPRADRGAPGRCGR